MSLRPSLVRLAARPRRSAAALTEINYNPLLPPVDLVGPPDPISNIRPITYARPSPSSSSSSSSSPASSSSSLNPPPPPARIPFTPFMTLRNFRTEFERGASPLNRMYTPNEFPTPGGESPAQREYRRHREALDAFNDSFWASNNIRFAAGLASALSTAEASALASLPPTATDTERSYELDEAREIATAKFHQQWVEGERASQKAWMVEWWKGQAGVLRRWGAEMLHG